MATTPDDDATAARLSAEQLARCRAVAASTGKPLREIAETYGYLRPAPSRVVPVLQGVLATTAILVAIGSTWTALHWWGEDRRRELEAAREKMALDAKPPPPPSRDDTPARIEAEDRLRSGRDALRYAENNPDLKPNERSTRLLQAADDFRAYLRVHPGSAAVHHDLARSLEALGRLPEALVEYEEAAKDPSYSGMVERRISELKKILAGR